MTTTDPNRVPAPAGELDTCRAHDGFWFQCQHLHPGTPPVSPFDGMTPEVVAAYQWLANHPRPAVGLTGGDTTASDLVRATQLAAAVLAAHETARTLSAPPGVDDDDECPTESQLEHLRAFHGTPRQFVEAFRALWWPGPDYVRETPSDGPDPERVLVDVSTVGWSGNEQIMGTVTGTLFHLLWWKSTHRGGHYVYEIPVTEYDAQWDLGTVGRTAKAVAP